MAELISCFDSKKKKLCQVQSDFEALIDAFGSKIEHAKSCVAQADRLRDQQFPPSPTHELRCSPSMAHKSSSENSGQSKLEVANPVLVAGDVNLSQARNVLRKLLRYDRRLSVYGASKHALADTVAFCTSWLQCRSETLVILHSGLNDVLSIEENDKVNINSAIEAACTAIKELYLACQRSNSTLMVCSIPEVVDFNRRIDLRCIAFEFNSALKTLSNELGFEFIDIAHRFSTNRPLMAVDGTHYNKHGQLIAMSAIAEPIDKWLEIHPDPQREELASKHQTLNKAANSVEGSPKLVSASLRSLSKKSSRYGDSQTDSYASRSPAALTERKGYSSTACVLKNRRNQYIPVNRLPKPNPARCMKNHGAPIRRHGSYRSGGSGYRMDRNNNRANFLDPWLPGLAPWEVKRQLTI